MPGSWEEEMLHHGRKASRNAISEDIRDFIGNYIYIHGMTGPLGTPALTATALITAKRDIGQGGQRWCTSDA